MSGEDGLWATIQAEWIKVCPCRLIRKNICMFLIVVRCVGRDLLEGGMASKYSPVLLDNPVDKCTHQMWGKIAL